MAVTRLGLYGGPRTTLGASAAAVIVQPVLPITAPSFRSIDAKSLADVYNRGTPSVADYEFSNKRRFFQ